MVLSIVNCESSSMNYVRLLNSGPELKGCGVQIPLNFIRQVGKRFGIKPLCSLGRTQDQVFSKKIIPKYIVKKTQGTVFGKILIIQDQIRHIRELQTIPGAEIPFKPIDLFRQAHFSFPVENFFVAKQ